MMKKPLSELRHETFQLALLIQPPLSDPEQLVKAAKVIEAYILSKEGAENAN